MGMADCNINDVWILEEILKRSELHHLIPFNQASEVEIWSLLWDYAAYNLHCR